jgi:two-component system response regulator NreC
MNEMRILIADDHATVREGLKMIIDAQPDMKTVGETGNGDAAVALAQELRPDVVLMDISMPGLNGSKATKKITDCCPNVRVVALTRHTESGYVQDLLRAGAAAYVLKQSSSEELIRAIRAVGSGNNYLDPAVTTRVFKDYSGRLPQTSNRQVSLTDREAEVLKLIASGYSNKEVAARLVISVKTVEAHKANSMKKLDLTSRIDIVNYALLQGWLETN